MPFIIAIIAIIVLLYLLIQFWPLALSIAVIWSAAVLIPKISRQIRKNRYFASDEFLAHKHTLESVVNEHNDITQYTAEIRARGSFELGTSSTGSQSHLATFENTSHFNYQRDRNLANLQSGHVHNCSLQVVRNASMDPLKYLMKYFNVKADEAHLKEVERLGEEISRLEDAVENLKKREAAIAESIAPPEFILKYFADEFNEQVGIELVPISVPYPEYVFEYVSAGGNSSQRTKIELNSETIDALIDRLATKIRFQTSAEGQRRLMTVKLRNLVKARDQHTCQYCAVSIQAEPHLLLEVDHITPVSRGGMSTMENLQTLCWRCNRSKSNKIIGA